MALLNKNHRTAEKRWLSVYASKEELEQKAKALKAKHERNKTIKQFSKEHDLTDTSVRYYLGKGCTFDEILKIKEVESKDKKEVVPKERTRKSPQYKPNISLKDIEFSGDALPTLRQIYNELTSTNFFDLTEEEFFQRIKKVTIRKYKTKAKTKTIYEDSKKN